MSTAGMGIKRQSAAEMPSVITGRSTEEALSGLHERISKRAYELFEELGHADGNDLSHWLRAESELCPRIPEVKQSGAWYSVTTPLGGVPAEQVKVLVDDQRAIITAAMENRETSPEFGKPERTSVYYSLQWPESVTPSSASAYLKDGMLTVLARKADAEDSAEPPLEGRTGGGASDAERQNRGARRARR